jgi:hypothetical protein
LIQIEQERKEQEEKLKNKQVIQKIGKRQKISNLLAPSAIASHQSEAVHTQEKEAGSLVAWS